MRVQQRFHFVLQSPIVAAGVAQKGRPIVRFPAESRMKQLLDPIPAVGVGHGLLWMGKQ
jgi:hypothetical protein